MVRFPLKFFEMVILSLIWTSCGDRGSACSWDLWELCTLTNKSLVLPDLCDPGQHLRSSGLRPSHHLHNQDWIAYFPGPSLLMW